MFVQSGLNRLLLDEKIQSDEFVRQTGLFFTFQFVPHRKLNESACCPLEHKLQQMCVQSAEEGHRSITQRGCESCPKLIHLLLSMTDVLEKLTVANNVVSQRFEAGIRRQQAANQKLRRLVKFEMGDKVLAFTLQLSPKPGLSLTKKLAAFWQRPPQHT